jgi:hypothetical protein
MELAANHPNCVLSSELHLFFLFPDYTTIFERRLDLMLTLPPARSILRSRPLKISLAARLLKHSSSYISNQETSFQGYSKLKTQPCRLHLTA